MTKIGTTTVFTVGNAMVVRVPAKLRQDKDWPFKLKDEPTMRLVRKPNGKFKVEIEAEE